MDDTQNLPDLLESSRLEAIEKYGNYLGAEEELARQDGGFFEKQHWKTLVLTKTEWQAASNKFYVLLHELAK